MHLLVAVSSNLRGTQTNFNPKLGGGGGSMMPCIGVEKIVHALTYFVVLLPRQVGVGQGGVEEGGALGGKPLGEGGWVLEGGVCQLHGGHPLRQLMGDVLGRAMVAAGSTLLTAQLCYTLRGNTGLAKFC